MSPRGLRAWLEIGLEPVGIGGDSGAATAGGMGESRGGGGGRPTVADRQGAVDQAS